MTPLLALAVSLAAALAGGLGGGLSRSGVAAASLIGALVLSATGWPGAAALGMFFLPATLVGRLSARRPGVSDARGERRDAVQVLANGGAAALGAQLEYLSAGLGLWVVTGSLAAAAADTWATGLGALSRQPPRLLTSGRQVAPGTSGGVTRLGSLGALAGAALVAGTGAAATGDAALFRAALAIGFGGMALDSLLGATLQARFVCPACDAASERTTHRCGAATRQVGGRRWLDNDGVNALATGLAGLAAAVWRLS